MEKLLGLSKEAEISFVFSQLLHANAFEWAYFICLLRQNQDIQAFCSKLFNGIEGPDRNANLNNFVKNVSPGTEELIKWATEQWYPCECNHKALNYIFFFKFRLCASTNCI